MLQAKRRFKVLLREQQRLQEKGQPDAELENQLRLLVEQYPTLQEGGTSSVSEGTKAMLAFGEAMSTSSAPPTERATAGASASITTPPSNSTPSSHESAHRAGEPELQPPAATSPQPAKHHPPPPQPQRKKQDPSPAALLRTLATMAFAVRLYRDFCAVQPATSPVVLGLVALTALSAAAYHVTSVVDLCSATGFATDPLKLTVVLHFFAVGRTMLPGRWLPERIIVYVFRELAPSLATAFVVYVAMLNTLSSLLERYPRRFCFL